MKFGASAFILHNKSQDDISDLGKDLMVDIFGGRSITLSSLSHIIFTKKVAPQLLKHLSLWTAFSQLHLQQDSIANVCTFKSWYHWYGRGWQMKWTQLSGDEIRKIISSFQLCADERMLRFTNYSSWKLSIATVRGNANPLDAAADAMDYPALLHVALAKLKNVTIQATLKRSIMTIGWHSKLNALKLILWIKVFVH